MSDRGIKKWAPYKSLVEQSPHLINMMKSKAKREKPILSEDDEAEINNILVNYNKEKVLIKFYRDGYIYEIETIIKKIEPNEKYLLLEDKEKILFSELYKISIV